MFIGACRLWQVNTEGADKAMVEAAEAAEPSEEPSDDRRLSDLEAKVPLSCVTAPASQILLKLMKATSTVCTWETQTDVCVLPSSSAYASYQGCRLGTLHA